LYKKTFKPSSPLKIMKKQKGFFEKKSVVATFGILAMLGGILFLTNSLSTTVTGNVINPQEGILDLVPAIGWLLVICAAVLIIYAVVKKE